MATSTLMAGAALLGLAGAAHCTAMCAAPCAAVCRRGAAHAANAWTFHVARIFGYASGGAVVAAGVGTLASLGSLSSGLQPLWLLMHLAALAFGLWLLFSGRQPAWLEGMGRRGGLDAVVAMPGSAARRIGPRANIWPTALTGMAWVAWPCGLLQAALLMAALADDAAGGAAVMMAFAICTTPGLVAVPWLWQVLRGTGTTKAGPSIAWALRASGALLAGSTVWALGHSAYVRAICSL